MEYTILDMANDFHKDKEVIRRLIKKLDLTAVNEYTREHNNEALVYDNEVYDTVASQYQHKTKQAQTSGTDNSAQSAMIKLLQEQLDRANKDKDQLMYLLQQSQSLSSTLQGRINLIENRQTEDTSQNDSNLDNEVEDTPEVKEIKEDKQSLFSRIFRR